MPTERQQHPRDTVSRNAIGALLAVTFAYPIILCAAFFPTPSDDLREHINLGLTFPLHTWPNPPLQTWIAGTVALTGARDSWLFVAVAQLLNVIGLTYLVRTARAFIGDEKVLPLVIMFCGGLYYSAATPSMALNADQIQVPIAAGIFFHAMMAACDNRWRDWLAFGALAGLAVLAKYTSFILLAAMLGAALYEPALRGIFRNVRLYAAGALALSIVALNVVPELSHPDALSYAATQFDVTGSLARRGAALWHVLRSLFLYGSPIVLGLIALAWRGHLRTAWPRDPWRTFIVATGAGIVLLLVVLILFGGLNYSTRHGFPYFGIWLLTLVTVLNFPPPAVRDFGRVMLACWAILLVGTLIFSQVALHSVLREPSPAAAQALHESWERQFRCGPAFIIGDGRAARGIAINFGRPMTAIALNELDRPGWFDPERVRRLGAIVIMTLDMASPPLLQPWLKDSPAQTLALPYRRTLRQDRQIYIYYVVAPRGC